MSPSKPSVLIVDPSDESREVLRTALERDGVECFEARSSRDAVAMARQKHPGVMVVDVDHDPDSAAWMTEPFDSGDAPALVILGTVRPGGKAYHGPPLGEGEFVRKPYHYAPLVRKIEALLADRPQSAVRRAA